MIRSMTAFARAVVETEQQSFTCEIRSVNHRFLELTVRCPDEFRLFEMQVREQARQQLSRGKLDIILSSKQKANDASAIVVNEVLVGQLSKLERQLRTHIPDAKSLTIAEVLKWPGVIEASALSEDELSAHIASLLNDAIAQLITAREREGEKLKQVILEYVQQLGQFVEQVKQRLPEVMSWIKTRIEKRFEEVSLKLDEDRLEQEMMLFTQRLDVEEELKRLETHLDEVQRIMSSKNDKSVGRRLDFLMQELNREANTLCSKSMDAKTTSVGVEMKVLIEQMREQIQNIE